MKYLQKRLVCETDLREFADRYYEVIRVKLDLEFLKGCSVYGFYGGHGKMIAGYAMNSTPPFRILKLIPTDRNEGRGFYEAYKGEFSELIAMWKISRSKFFLSLFYLQVMATLLRCESKWLLGAAVKKHVHDLYIKFLPNIIYSGGMDPGYVKAGGTGNERIVWIQYGNIRHMSHRFSVEGARYLSQQFCLKILPRFMMAGKLEALGNWVRKALTVIFYPFARGTFFLAKLFRLVQQHYEDKEVRVASSGTQEETKCRQ